MQVQASGGFSALAVSAVSFPTKENVSQRWYSITGSRQIPVLVIKLLNELNKLEAESGQTWIEGDKRHRALYTALSESEQKFQVFAARQLACRFLGTTGYLCDQCWLPAEEDCICGKIVKEPLWCGIKLWVYMHPKEFLRKNNTGKLLWQTFGFSSVSMCVYGVEEQENAMWSHLEKAGADRVWCLYPERSYQISQIPITDVNDDDEFALHFILMDGTWCNSKAMLSRMNNRANRLWNVEEMPCVALSPDSHSAMHHLRPQPSIERTCTAAASGQLLREVSLRKEMTMAAAQSLNSSANVIDASIKCLFDALASRRHRMGRSICR